MGKITREDRIVIKVLRVQKNCVLSVKCLKFAPHHFLLYVVYMCQNYWILPMHSNVTIKNVSWSHWPTLYIEHNQPNFWVDWSAYPRQSALHTLLCGVTRRKSNQEFIGLNRRLRVRPTATISALSVDFCSRHSLTRTRTELGWRAFAVCGPDVWNSLPPSLRTMTYLYLYLSVDGLVKQSF